MSGLLKLYQIKGGQQIRDDLDALLESYEASKVITTVIEQEGSAGSGTVYYDTDKLLALLKVNVDRILQGSEDTETLKTLRDSISTLVESINDTQEHIVSDLIKVELERINGEVSVPVIEGITDLAAPLEVYSTDNRPMFNHRGEPLTFILLSKTFNGTPAELDIETAIQDNREEAYKPITGDFKFKVYPIGTWELGAIPQEALLDNTEFHSISYDRAINKIIIAISANKALLARIKEQLGNYTIEDVITDLTNSLEARINTVETEGVKLTQLTGTETEEIKRATQVYTKNAVDEIIAPIHEDLGFNGTKLVKRVQNLEDTAIIKNKLLTVVRSTAENTSDECVLSERAITTKFVEVVLSVDNLGTALSNKETNLSTIIGSKFAKADIVTTWDKDKTSDEKVLSEKAVITKVEDIVTDLSNYKTAVSNTYVAQSTVTSVIDSSTLGNKIPNTTAIKEYVRTNIFGSDTDESTVKGLIKKMGDSKYSWNLIQPGQNETVMDSIHVYSQLAVDQAITAATSDKYSYTAIIGSDGTGHNPKETVGQTTNVYSAHAVQDLVASRFSQTALHTNIIGSAGELITQQTKFYSRYAVDSMISNITTTGLVFNNIIGIKDEEIGLNTRLYSKDATDQAIETAGARYYLYSNIHVGNTEVRSQSTPVYSKIAVDEILAGVGNRITAVDDNSVSVSDVVVAVNPVSGEPDEEIGVNAKFYTKRAVDNLVQSAVSGAFNQTVLLAALTPGTAESVTQGTKVYTAEAVDERIAQQTSESFGGAVSLLSLQGTVSETINGSTKVYTKNAVDEKISTDIGNIASNYYKYMNIVGATGETTSATTKVYSKNAIDDKLSAFIDTNMADLLSYRNISGKLGEQVSTSTKIYSTAAIDSLISTLNDRVLYTRITGGTNETVSTDTAIPSKKYVDDRVTSINTNKYNVSAIIGTASESINNSTNVYSKLAVDNLISALDFKTYDVSKIVTSQDEGTPSEETPVYSKQAIDDKISEFVKRSVVQGEQDETVTSDTKIYSKSAVDSLIETESYDYHYINTAAGEGQPTRSTQVYSIAAVQAYVANQNANDYKWNSIVSSSSEAKGNTTPVYSKLAADEAIEAAKASVLDDLGDLGKKIYPFISISGVSGQSITSDTQVYSSAKVDALLGVVSDNIGSVEDDITALDDSTFKWSGIVGTSSETVSKQTNVYSTGYIDEALVSISNANNSVGQNAFTWSNIVGALVGGERVTPNAQTKVYSTNAVDQQISGVESYASDLVSNAVELLIPLSSIEPHTGESVTRSTKIYSKTAIDNMISGSTYNPANIKVASTEAAGNRNTAMLSEKAAKELISSEIENFRTYFDTNASNSYTKTESDAHYATINKAISDTATATLTESYNWRKIVVLETETKDRDIPVYSKAKADQLFDTKLNHSSVDILTGETTSASIHVMSSALTQDKVNNLQTQIDNINNGSLVGIQNQIDSLSQSTSDSFGAVNSDIQSLQTNKVDWSRVTYLDTTDQTNAPRVYSVRKTDNMFSQAADNLAASEARSRAHTNNVIGQLRTLNTQLGEMTHPRLITQLANVTVDVTETISVTYNILDNTEIRVIVNGIVYSSELLEVSKLGDKTILWRVSQFTLSEISATRVMVQYYTAETRLNWFTGGDS